MSNGDAEPLPKIEHLDILFTQAKRTFSQQEAMETLKRLLQMDQPEGTIGLTPHACAQLLRAILPAQSK